MVRHFALVSCLSLGLAGLPLAAGPVNFGTYLLADGVKSQFSSAFAQNTLNQGGLNLIALADLSQGALKTLNQRTSGFGGAGTQALFYDTITFDQSAFEGSFGASYNLNLTAWYDGTFQSNGTIQSAGVGGRIHVYSGSTVVDSSVFQDPASLTNFLFLGGPTPLCANGVNGPDLTSFSGAFSYSVSCSVTVNALNPTVRIFMNLPAFLNASAATWSLDMMNTATLDLGDLGGRKVFSASGVLPGTQPAPVPEPSTVALTAAGLAFAILRRRK